MELLEARRARCAWRAHRFFLWHRFAISSRPDLGSTSLMKPELTIERLIQGGFQQVGCWELNDKRDLTHAINLP